ncbi:DUF3800 domain-containing protein [Rhodovarius crocodyli]|uniref:DUF3800 domain-containing protein n=1 Tax=Rhodovarius crocodyli TaxID=1979269 RepID=A0A437LV68_9PROT|nr:DUF3800 domain-containing protein [Rhodovarius crocodyli]RVT89289.1 DUF3800 domain-containing protein [Rhodovarius crocodyli]
MTEVLHLACDEAGFTGSDLLATDQRYFAYAAVNITDDEAFALLQEAKALFPVQMPELKSTKLIKTPNGRKLIRHVIQRIAGRYSVAQHDKLLALCANIFEYIYEPVFADDPWLLYEKNFNNFIMMYCWLWFQENDDASEAVETIRQFQAYMRTNDPEKAPLLFAKSSIRLSQQGVKHPFELIQAFATGFRDRIVADNADMREVVPDGGKWTLDVCGSAMWSTLNYWGRLGRPLEVQCDDNKPLRAIAPILIGDDTDPGIIRARRMGDTRPLGWKFASPLRFTDSRGAPAIQIADLVAGTALHGRAHGLTDELADIASDVLAATLEDSIFMIKESINLDAREPTVNWAMMFGMAVRASQNTDPRYRLAEFFGAAEVLFDRGELRRQDVQKA